MVSKISDKGADITSEKIGDSFVVGYEGASRGRESQASILKWLIGAGHRVDFI